MNSPSARKRFVAVGTGHRINMFIDPLVQNYSEYCELVALSDISLTRANYHARRLQAAYGCPEIPTYTAADFETMVREKKPDVIIVCTTDATHHEYIIKAMELGCDVVTEKPLTTDARKCRAVFDAVERTGKKVRVSFNARWTPLAMRVRELLAAGTIGEIKAVNMEYQLDTSHGADYFRRWHSCKACSGGLQIHKSTHHFDLVNWWIDAIPQEVFAFGSLSFYGKENAVARGQGALTEYARYTGVAAAQDDPFSINLADNGRFEQLYLEAESESGYIRDRNVFRAGIDIEDTIGALVKYRTGVMLNYSLVAYSPQEGYRVTFTGDKGRIELTEMYRACLIEGAQTSDIDPHQNASQAFRELRVMPHFGKGYEVEIPEPEVEGGHGGSDPRLQRQIFHPDPPADTLGCGAGHEQGAASLLIGAAINESLATGRSVLIDELCPLPRCSKNLKGLI